MIRTGQQQQQQHIYKSVPCISVLPADMVVPTYSRRYSSLPSLSALFYSAFGTSNIPAISLSTRCCSPLISRARRNNGFCTKHTNCHVCAMSLLTYGFTATAKERKKTPEPIKTSGKSWSTSNNSITYVQGSWPKTSLPPLPNTARLALSQHESKHKRRLSRSKVTIRRSPAPRRRPREVAQCVLPSPPSTSTSRPSTDNSPASVDSPPIQFTATLFPPLSNPPPQSRKLPPGVQRSSRRIQDITQAKQLSRLAVPHTRRNAGHNPRNSIGVTPISAYAGHSFSDDFNRPGLSLQPNMFPAPWEQEMALTPIEMDLGALEAIANLPETARPSRKQSMAQAASFKRRKSVFRGNSRKPVLAVELPGGSLMTVITPEQSAWQRAPYVPGRIRMESKTRTGRSPLTFIQESVAAELGADKEKDAAEEAIVDELLAFVESFGEDFQLQETDIDAFWLNQAVARFPKVRSGGLLSPLSTASTPVQSPLASDMPHRPLRPSKCDSHTLQEVLDMFGDLDEPEFIRGPLTPPSANFTRSSFTSEYSNSSLLSLSAPGVTYSLTPLKHPYGGSASSLHSTGQPSIAPSEFTSPQKVRQVKGKGASSPFKSQKGQKLSFKGLLRSAASIV